VADHPGLEGGPADAAEDPTKNRSLVKQLLVLIENISEQTRIFFGSSVISLLQESLVHELKA